MSIDPLHNSSKPPSKEDLEDFLGISRYRRFDLIYEELISLKLDDKFMWSELDKIWFIRFYTGKVPIFSIRWGIDFFYAYLTLEAKYSKKIARHKDITPDALELLRKNPSNPMKHTTGVEANLEMMKEQEAFFQLLPVLIRVLG